MAARTASAMNSPAMPTAVRRLSCWPMLPSVVIANEMTAPGICLASVRSIGEARNAGA